MVLSLIIATSARSTASTPLCPRPRQLPISKIPCRPGARRTHDATRSSSPGSTDGIRLHGKGPFAVRSPPSSSSSPLVQGKSSDDVPRGDASSSHGGVHGGGRGGGGDVDKAGGGGMGDEDDASKELQVRPLLNKRKPAEKGLVASALSVLAGNAVLASLQKNRAIRFLLQLIAPFLESEVTVLWGVLITDKRSSDPSFSDCCSTTSTVVNNQVGDEISYSSDNEIDETASAPNNRNAYVLEMGPMNMNHSETTINVHDENDTTNRHPSTAPLLNTSPINSPEVNNKGFLGFLNTLVGTLFVLYSALFTFSVTYPSSAKALVSFDEAWTQRICVINLMSFLASVVMLPFASRFKGDKSTNEHDGFGFFIWALYLLLLVLIPEYILTLHVYLHIPAKLTVWSFGTTIISLTLFMLPMVCYIEGQRPTLCEYMRKILEESEALSSSFNTLGPLGATGLDMHGAEGLTTLAFENLKQEVNPKQQLAHLEGEGAAGGEANLDHLPECPDYQPSSFLQGLLHFNNYQAEA